jgi:hypothetical protein
MAQQTISVGTVANDGSGDPARTAFNKINANFSELYPVLTGGAPLVAADISDSTATGRAVISAADAAALTALSNVFSSTLKGVAPASGGSANTFLNGAGAFTGTAAGKAMLEAATATAQTALLSAVVGDSGSGGTKGLVPAPATGDAAAGKFLKADGTFAVPASGGTPAGSTGQPQYNSAGAFGAMTGVVWTDATKNWALTAGTVTTSQPMMSFQQGWNNAATTFVGYDININYTAAGAGSSMFTIRDGSTNHFQIDRFGQGYFNSGANFGAAVGGSVLVSVGAGISIANNRGLSWTNSGNVTGTIDAGVFRNAAGVMEINNGVAGTFRDLKLRSVIQNPPSSVAPAVNGEMVVEATSNTTLTFKLKGTDGTVRTATLTLT